jgi:hypothetical protein
MAKEERESGAQGSRSAACSDLWHGRGDSGAAATPLMM